MNPNTINSYTKHANIFHSSVSSDMFGDNFGDGDTFGDFGDKISFLEISNFASLWLITKELIGNL